MEIIMCNPEILNSASSATKKSDDNARSMQVQGDIMTGLMASATAYNNLLSIANQDTTNTTTTDRTTAEHSNMLYSWNVCEDA